MAATQRQPSAQGRPLGATRPSDCADYPVLRSTVFVFRGGGERQVMLG